MNRLFIRALKVGLLFHLITLWIGCGDSSDLYTAEQTTIPREQQGEDESVSGKRDDINANDLPGGNDEKVEPIHALYLTNYMNRWHDYETQQQDLIDGLSRLLKIEFHLVGKDAEDTLTLMEAPQFGMGYDVIIYNMCFADDFNLERINNIISQTRDAGIPAVLLHCTMHSFQQTSPSYPEHELELRVAELDWAETHPEVDFPYWWRFTGVDTLSHDWSRELTATRVEGEHPLVLSAPQNIQLTKDELYRVIKIKEGVTPLYVAYSRESRREHLVAWIHEVGAGQVLATTLGHNHHTTQNTSYHRLIANGIAQLTGRLDINGLPDASSQGSLPTPNYQATVTCQPSDVFYPQNIAQLQEIVSDAWERNRSLKVISVPQSNSNSEFICPEHGGILINLGRMNQVLNLDEERMTVTVQPGVRAFELSAYLHEYDLAIPAMPDYTGVSIAGGIATSAHHSSLKFATGMADMVESLLVVDGRSELRRLEGAEAAAAAVHLGMLGIVVEITLNVEPQFKLQYGFEKGRDDELENHIEESVRAHDYARVMWFAGNGRYVLDYYDRVDPSEPGNSKHNVWTSTGSVFRFVGDLPYRVLNRAPLRVQCDSALLRSKIWTPPLNVKNSSGARPVGWSHEMLGSECSSGTCPWDTDSVRSRTMEASFPLSQLSSWMSDVRAIIEQNRACFPILGIYLRFSQASDRWLGFNYGEDVISFEIHIPKIAAETYHERSADVYDEIMQMTLSRYHARPHWGKNSSPIFMGIGAKQYPRWDDFVKLKREIDPKSLFENKLWRQLNLNAPLPTYPGCAMARDCICEEDSHCGDRYRCAPGGYYTAARVCRED